MITLNINGQSRGIDVPPDMPLLWVLRDVIRKSRRSKPLGTRPTARLDLEVVQCGYCQSGQIMSATALLNATPRPDDWFWCVGGKAEEFVPFEESMNDSTNRARPDLSRSQVPDRDH